MNVEIGTNAAHCSVWSVFFTKRIPLSSLGKVFVEESVEDRVGACAGHTEYVTDEEGQHHLFCKTKINNFYRAYGGNSLMSALSVL